MDKRWTLGPIIGYMLFLLGVSIFLVFVIPGWWKLLIILYIVFIGFLLRYLYKLYRSI